MNTKDNQRTRITKMLIKQSYLRLMSEKQTGKITVKDICERAEINRSTFYLHYAEPNQILMELEDETIEKQREALYSIGALEDDEISVKNYLISFLRHIHKNEDLYSTLLIKNTDPHFRKKLYEVSEEITTSAFKVPLPPELLKPVYRFVVSGSLEIICDWIKNDFSMPEQNLCDMLYALNEGCVGAFVKKLL